MLPYHRVILLDGYGFGKGITEQRDNRGQNFYNAEYHNTQILTTREDSGQNSDYVSVLT